MISAPSVSGVEAGASRLGGCGQVLTAMTLELPTALPRMLKPVAVKMTDAALRAVNPYGPRIMATTWACMGEPMDIACSAQVLGAPIQGMPAGRRFTDALAGPGRLDRHGTRTAALTR